MKTAPALGSALSQIPHLTINIGNFDHHQALLDAFGVRAIANWQIIEPDRCDAPATTWTRVAHRTIERKAGRPDVTPEELAGWLLAQASPSKPR
jgi:hypothetical protein